MANKQIKEFFDWDSFVDELQKKRKEGILFPEEAGKLKKTDFPVIINTKNKQIEIKYTTSDSPKIVSTVRFSQDWRFKKVIRYGMSVWGKENLSIINDRKNLIYDGCDPDIEFGFYQYKWKNMDMTFVYIDNDEFSARNFDIFPCPTVSVLNRIEDNGKNKKEAQWAKAFLHFAKINDLIIDDNCNAVNGPDWFIFP